MAFDKHSRWAVALVVLAGCPYGRRPDPPAAPERPVAIAGINSPFDDFNSVDMTMFTRHQLVFSTNRGSQGANFDLYQASLSWDSGSLVPGPATPFAAQLMSDRDERGPLAFDAREWSHGSYGLWFSLTSDRAGGAGGLDLYATECSGNYHPHRAVPCGDATELEPLPALNTSADDAYLSSPFDERSVLFASNREGTRQMDIYAARWGASMTLRHAPASVTRVDALSSDADDTAPFVVTAYEKPAELVFVSSRPGGLGEHDIYCSRYDKGAWSAPKNLGPTINSAKDEYRPIVITVNTTRFLIFSSTREGGQGGYDLYIAGYPGC